MIWGEYNQGDRWGRNRLEARKTSFMPIYFSKYFLFLYLIYFILTKWMKVTVPQEIMVLTLTEMLSDLP